MEVCAKIPASAYGFREKRKSRRHAPQAHSSFTSYMDEGIMHQKKMAHRKAKFCFDRALELKPDDPLALTLRSQCSLNLGLHDEALLDAEKVAETDSKFAAGLYQLGETLFSLGFFERALIRFHQGNRYRKSFGRFQAGIIKSKAAIEESILDRAATQIEDVEEMIPLIEEIEREDNIKKIQCCIRSISAEVLLEKRVSLLPPKNAEREKWVAREILGNLASHKFFVKRILAKLSGNQTTVRSNFEEILFFLEHHEKLLRYMKPMYARKRGLNFSMAMVHRYEIEALAQRHSSRQLLKDAAETAILKNIMQIEHALSIARNSDAQLEAERSLRQLKKTQLSHVPRKYEFILDIMHYRAIALSRQRMYDKAIDAFKKEIKLGQKLNNEMVISRALDFLGRAQALAGNFSEAVEAWESRLEYAKTPLERAYTYHEIGRANLELGKKELSRYFATEALNTALELGSYLWAIFAMILLGQIDLKAKSLHDSLEQFEGAKTLAFEHNSTPQMRKILTDITQCLKIMIEKQTIEATDSDKNEDT